MIVVCVMLYVCALHVCNVSVVLAFVFNALWCCLSDCDMMMLCVSIVFVVCVCCVRVCCMCGVIVLFVPFELYLIIVGCCRLCDVSRLFACVVVDVSCMC